MNRFAPAGAGALDGPVACRAVENAEFADVRLILDKGDMGLYAAHRR